MPNHHPVAITVNGRNYRWPSQPVVVVCVDGCQPDYIAEAMSQGRMPFVAQLAAKGAARTALAVLPSYTNPNNMSIITGVPPAIHGICGNYFYDALLDQEVMMNDPKYLRATTIPSAFARAGAKVAIVTAKDKLRRMLGHELDFSTGRTIAFSAEFSDRTNLSEHGIADIPAWLGRPTPSVYSADVSEFVLAAGVKLLAEFQPDLMYLSTTDYIQHKFGPQNPVALAFYAMLDRYFAELDRLGAALVITADHGMLPKHNHHGEPNVIYLQDVLDDWLGRGVTKVILPITDPYVVHHGSLGSFATVHLPASVDSCDLKSKLQALPEFQVVLNKEEACARFELPNDRLGDLVVVSTDDWTIGTSLLRHDLSGLTEPLRSHGGLGEQLVPLITNRLVNWGEAPLRNFDAFDVALNRV